MLLAECDGAAHMYVATGAGSVSLSLISLPAQSMLVGRRTVDGVAELVALRADAGRRGDAAAPWEAWREPDWEGEIGDPVQTWELHKTVHRTSALQEWEERQEEEG